MADISLAASPRERTVLDLSPAGFSRLLTGFSRRACLLAVNLEPLSPAALANVDILLLTNFSSAKPMAAAELEAIKGFVEKGGVWVLALNETSPQVVAAFSSVIEGFGVRVEAKPVEVTSASRAEMLASLHYKGDALKSWLGDGKWNRLYFRGVPLTISVKAAGRTDALPWAQHPVPLLRYDDATLAVMCEVGKGRAYIFSAGDLISNAFSAFRARDTFYHPENFPANNRLIDALTDELLASVRKRGPVAVPKP
jgi:hypothetical protein